MHVTQSLTLIKTSDGWTIAAAYAPAKKRKPTAILVHGVAAGRGEYDAFASTLQARGWGTLALDLRGHGDSTSGPRGREDYRGFDASGEWPKAVEDVLAAAKFLRQQGVPEEQLVLIGSSIGANLCALAYASLPKARALVLLSPGAEYRGVKLRADKRAVAGAFRGDPYAYLTTLKLRSLGATMLQADRGHGAQMLSDPAFLAALLKKLGA